MANTFADRYRPLASFQQKLRFVIDIQIAIFDSLHGRLKDNLEAYLTRTSTLGRTMGTVSKEEQDKLLGLEGLEHLCKTYGSADYLGKAMRDWSDDVVSTLPVFPETRRSIKLMQFLAVLSGHLGRAAISSTPNQQHWPNGRCRCR